MQRARHLRARRFFVRSVILAVLLGLTIVAPAAGQEELTLTITDMDLSQFPTATAVLQVGGPAALATGEATPASATVQIDGRRVTSFSMQPTEAEPLPTATLLLIDESGSMRGEAARAAQQAAETYIKAMRDVDKVAIYAFNENVRTLADFSGDRQALVASLANLSPTKETALYDALLDSLRTAQTPTGVTSRYVIVLSDGGDTVSSTTLDQVVAAARAAGVQVYAVGLKTDEFDATPLLDVTAAAGGRYLETPEPAALTALYASLAREIQNQYVLNLTMDESARGSGSGRLDVTVNMGDASASNSRGFFYPEGSATHVETAPVSTVEPAPPEKPAPTPAPTSAGILSGFLAWDGSDLVVALLTAILLFMAIYLGVVVLLPKRDVLSEYSDILDNRSRLAPKAAPHADRGPLELLVNRVLTARGWGDPIQRRIEDAGWRMRTSEFVVLQLTAVLACAVLMWFVPVPGLLKLAAVIAVALGPLVFLDRKAAKRRRRFEDQIPDVLTLMANSLRAGQGFEQALQVVANEGPDPSAHEFRRLLAQQRLGVSPEETLRTLADRMQSEAFGWVVMVTAIQREVGGNLAEVYTNIAETLRERAKLRREVDTLTAEGKLSAGILILLPIVVGALIYLLNRAYFMLLLTTRGGQVMICGTLTLMVVGIVWMRRIIHFEI